MLYMAQLQEKIRIEQMAKEKLGIQYENSLNKGAEEFNAEAAELSESPLVKEISLIVAQTLQRQSMSDPQLKEIIEN